MLIAQGYTKQEQDGRSGLEHCSMGIIYIFGENSQTLLLSGQQSHVWGIVVDGMLHALDWRGVERIAVQANDDADHAVDAEVNCDARPRHAADFHDAEVLPYVTSTAPLWMSKTIGRQDRQATVQRVMVSVELLPQPCGLTERPERRHGHF